MTMHYDFDLVCIGSGPAGQRAAVQAAKLGKRAAIVERGHVIGGVCVDTGTIPSKTFREAVLSLNGRAFPDSRQTRSRSVVRPSAQELLARVEEVEQRQADIITDQLRRNDVAVFMGEASFKDAHRVAVLSDQGSALVTAANILIAVGTTPAPPPGVSTEPGLVVTSDELLQLTSLPRRLAVVGDVIGYPGLATTSAEQGRLAACYAFGVETKPMAHFPIGIYSIPEISMVGETEHELTDRKVPYETGTARYREIARGHILGDDSGLLKMLFQREDHRLLGVHVIGTGATELIHIGQAVLGLRGSLDYFLTTAFNYPTLAECYKVAALDAYNKLNA